jgi:aminoglycoside/choline kinase family phosphotransferase
MGDKLQTFLQQTGWDKANISWFSADWSVRSYARLEKNNGQSAILLKSPPDDSPDAMVGHMIGPWSKINKHFKSIGLNVPTIIAEDLDSGFILMDDFGDKTIAGLGIDAYMKATDVLITMRDHPNALNIDLINYEDTHVYQALRFFPQYVTNTNESDWFAAWKDIENALPPCTRALTHIDYAPQNLMWVDDKIGIIDFQAACSGPFVYDIVNLLEDIRIDVPDDIKQTCKNHYCASLSPNDRDLFEMWYPVITAQFHARILGQIQYLYQEKGRDDLLRYYDPLMKRFKKEVEHRALKRIKDLL